MPPRSSPTASARPKTTPAAAKQAYRYIETLPGGVKHAIFKMRDNGPLDNTPEVTVPPDRLFVMGDNRDNSADSRVPVREGGVGLLPMDNLVGRADAVVGSWDHGHPQPAGMDLAVRFPRRAVFHRGALRRIARVGKGALRAVPTAIINGVT